ncbi:MAG: TRAP transporter small permease subunit [Pseudomonadota bacterium]
MPALLKLSGWIDSVTAFIGRAVSWLILVAVLVSAGNAVVRKVFNESSNAWLELQWYLYGAVFMLAAAYTLQRNEHVRIDVATSGFSKRTRDWIDLFGHIFFLLPLCLLMVYLSWGFFMNAAGAEFVGTFPFIAQTSSPEISGNAGGLILWPAKMLVFVGFALLLAQAFSEIVKRFAIIRGLIEDDATTQHELPPIIEELETAADLEKRMDHK